MIGVQAPLGCRGLIEQGLEYTPTDTHDAFVFADAYAELDGHALWVPASVGGKPKEHCDLLRATVTRSHIVLNGANRVAAALYDGRLQLIHSFYGPDS